MAQAPTDLSATDFATGPAGPAWSALAGWLRQRGAELRAEVRDYPTPIARCDVQLTKLLEHRSGVLAALGRFQVLESGAVPGFRRSEEGGGQVMAATLRRN